MAACSASSKAAFSQYALGEALAVGLAAHGEVHADFGALTLEVGLEARLDFGVDVLGDADLVLVCPGLLAVLLDDLDKLRTGDLALGAGLGRSVADMDVAANGATELLHCFSPECE